MPAPTLRWSVWGGACRQQAQDPFAVRVDLLGKGADFLAEFGREAGVVVGEGEGVEAGGFDVYRVVAHTQETSRSQRPQAMDLAEQDAMVKGLAPGDSDQFVVGEDAGIQKLEQPMFGGFDGGDVAGKIGELFAQFWVGLSK